MTRFRVGVQLHPQRTSIDDLRAAWKEAERLGVDSLWTWDHFFPGLGPPEGPAFEGWTLLAAMAVDTTRVTFGMLVSAIGYRNPDLLAHMAGTIDQLSGGRLVLGVGSGWRELDYEEYGYEVGTVSSRLKDLEQALPRIKARLAALDPAPPGPLPILVGGAGERVTLRIVAEHADMWNSFGPPERFARKNAALDRWCVEVGRDPAEIERTMVSMSPDLAEEADAYLAAGATHLIFSCGHPFDFTPLQRLLEAAHR